MCTTNRTVDREPNSGGTAAIVHSSRSFPAKTPAASWCNGRQRGRGLDLDAPIRAMEGKTQAFSFIDDVFFVKFEKCRDGRKREYLYGPFQSVEEVFTLAEEPSPIWYEQAHESLVPSGPDRVEVASASGA